MTELSRRITKLCHSESIPNDPECGPPERHSVARFVLSRERQIRAIARGKLTESTRTVFDSEDVMSSVLRRLDNLARRGKLRPGSEQELWSLIKVIATNTAISKTRLIERSRSWVTDEPSYAYFLMKSLNACEDDDEANLLVYRMASTLTEKGDRHILLLRMRGAGHKAVAGLLGITEEASRKRWSRICRELRDRFGGEEP